MSKVVSRPALDVVQNGGTITIVDDTGTPRQMAGTQPDGTITTVDLNGPPPPAPVGPVVTPVQLGLSIAWNGALTAATPADFDHVEVHVSTAAGFVPDSTTRHGTLRRAGSLPVASLTAGTTYYAALVGVNTSGISGAASVQASGIPTQVIASAANFTARDIGGITTTFAPTAPASPLVGDLWYDSANDYRLNRYDGTVWAPVTFGTNAITAASIVSSLIAANTIGTRELAAVIVLASTIVAGTEAGARVQIDSTGLHAYNDAGDLTVSIGSDGSASFSGASAQVTELDADRVVVSSATGGGVFAYSTGSSPLNSNTITGGTDGTAVPGWTGDAPFSTGKITYSATYKYNGHNTMRVGRTQQGVARGVTSNTVPVTVGAQYSATATLLNDTGGLPVYAGISWRDGSNNTILRTNGPVSSTYGEFVTVNVTGVAPPGATQAVIHLANSTGGSGATTDFYVGFSAIYSASVLSSMANDAGSDAFGNDYPAGFSTPFGVAAGGKVTAGNMDADVTVVDLTTGTGTPRLHHIAFNKTFAGVPIVTASGDITRPDTVIAVGNASTTGFYITARASGADVTNLTIQISWNAYLP